MLSVYDYIFSPIDVTTYTAINSRGPWSVEQLSIAGEFYVNPYHEPEP